MNDDQIRSELERRAAAMSSRHEWARRDLLPAVREQIDTRPQRVTTTSLLSPRLGIAAVVAALLVLVVAVPRLAPQPPASSGSLEPSPSASFPSVMSPAEFFNGWRSGAIRGRSVLVEGSIGEGGFTTAVGGRPPCLPPDPCPWGSLLGIDPGLAVYARRVAVPEGGQGLELDGRAWPSWDLPQVPVSGTLLLSVDIDGRVIFDGLVRPFGSALEWELSDAAAADISTFRPDDVAIVRGHLFNPYPPDTVRFCRLQAHPDLEGLPSRFCAHQDYLSDEIWRAGDRPRIAFVDVQAGAADQFAVADAALYAISPRLYGGGCDGPPPCWLWDVVARIDGPQVVATPPAPSDAPTPEVAPTPSPSPSGVSFDCPPTWTTGPDDVPLNTLHPTIVDITGLVVSCDRPDQRMFDSSDDGPRIGNPLGDLGLLQIEWAGDPCAAAMEFTLSRTGNAFTIQAQSTSTREYCILPLVVHALRLTLSAPIDASTVTFIWNDSPPPSPAAPSPSPSWELSPVGTDHAEADGAAFDLTIAADRTEYMAGEPIEVSSSLRSKTDVTVSCLWTPIISLEQLDGDLEFAPGPFVRSCPGNRDLRSGEEFATDFLPTAWGSSEPNPLEPYIRDGKLYLPPGTYRFVAKSSLNVGGLGFENGIRLEAAVVIQVARFQGLVLLPGTLPEATPTVGSP